MLQKHYSNPAKPEHTEYKPAGGSNQTKCKQHHSNWKGEFSKLQKQPVTPRVIFFHHHIKGLSYNRIRNSLLHLYFLWFWLSIFG